jgi:hypothetical protein
VQGMAAYVDAEEGVASAEKRLEHGTTAKTLTIFVDWLAALRTAKGKWRFAQSHLDDFKSSGDKLVAEVAGALADSYGMMADLYGRRVTLVEAALRSPNPNVSDMIIDASKIQSESRQLFELITLGTIGVTHTQVDLSRVDAAGHASYLKITRVQKTEIAGQLTALAGPSPGDESRDESRPAWRVPAVLLWRWFKQGYHGSDEK